MSRKSIIGWLVVLGAGAWLAVDFPLHLFSSLSSQPARVAAEPEEAPIDSVGAPALYALYEANGIAADERYKGKRIMVMGIVQSVDRDIMDEPYVALETVPRSAALIQCMLQEEQSGTASRLMAGDTVLMDGRVEGKLFNIILRNCIFR